MSGHLVRAILAAAAEGCWTALDVGSGPGIYRPRGVAVWTTVDAFYHPASDGHHQADIRHALPTFAAKSHDLVYALDVIEHLEKRDGEKLLDEMKRIARRRVLVFTPNGFRKQESENRWQVHRSGWSADELRARGFRAGVVDFAYEARLEPAASLWGVFEVES